MNLDTGNCRGIDLDQMYGHLAQLAPFSINVQVKVVMIGPGNKKVPADFKRLAKILTDAGYRGYIVLEYEESDDPRTACPKFVEQLRAAFS